MEEGGGMGKKGERARVEEEEEEGGGKGGRMEGRRMGEKEVEKVEGWGGEAKK